MGATDSREGGVFGLGVGAVFWVVDKHLPVRAGEHAGEQLISAGLVVVLVRPAVFVLGGRVPRFLRGRHDNSRWSNRRARSGESSTVDELGSKVSIDELEEVVVLGEDRIATIDSAHPKLIPGVLFRPWEELDGVGHFVSHQHRQARSPRDLLQLTDDRVVSVVFVFELIQEDGGVIARSEIPVTGQLDKRIPVFDPTAADADVRREGQLNIDREGGRGVLLAGVSDDFIDTGLNELGDDSGVSAHCVLSDLIGH